MSSNDDVEWNKPIPEVEVDLDLLEDNEMGGLMLNGELFTGIAVSSYPNGQIESRRPCLNSLPHGLCRWWHSNGQLQHEWTVYRGTGHGWETFWYPSGKVAKKTYSEFGQPLEWIEYDEAGQEKARGSNRNDPHALHWIERNRKLFPDAPEGA
jgi:hypothetical protein